MQEKKKEQGQPKGGTGSSPEIGKQGGDVGKGGLGTQSDFDKGKQGDFEKKGAGTSSGSEFGKSEFGKQGGDVGKQRDFEKQGEFGKQTDVDKKGTGSQIGKQGGTGPGSDMSTQGGDWQKDKGLKDKPAGTPKPGQGTGQQR